MPKALVRRVAQLLALSIAGCGHQDNPAGPCCGTPPEVPIELSFGNVQVTTITTGTDLDPTGFTIYLEPIWDYGYGPWPIAANAQANLINIPAGSQSFVLFDLEPNCSETGPAEHRVFVQPNSVTRVEFRVECVAAR